MMRVLGIALFWVLGLAVEVLAGESRCDELGANCLCSETFNTNSYSLVSGTQWGWDPGDTNSKNCAFNGIAGAAYELSTSGVNTKSATNSATLLNALPAGHSVSYVLRAEDDSGGLWNVGTRVPAGTSNTVRAFRAYVYFSNPYQYATGGSCGNNGKLVQLGPTGGIVTNSTGDSWSMYSWGVSDLWIASPQVNASSAQPDCCSIGPGMDSGANAVLDLDTLQGHWVRIEGRLKNTSGAPGFQFKLYMKDVTANGPEYVIIDTSLACSTTDCGAGTGWVSPDYTSNFRPAGGNEIEDLWLDLFRNGTCTGFTAVSHYLAAAWSTDSGQRIGAATEIEGGGVTYTGSFNGKVRGNGKVRFSAP